MTSPASPVQPAGRGPLFWVAALILIAGIAGAVFWYQHPPFLKGNAHKPGVVQTASGLQYQVLTPGNGPKPGPTDYVRVNYEGKLLNGKTFDKSEQPVAFQVNRVVPGFSEALQLMPRGAKYRFWMPPQLGYGGKEQRDQAGNVVIPANAVLQFDVELVDSITEAKLQTMMRQQMQGGQSGGAAPAEAVPAHP